MSDPSLALQGWIFTTLTGASPAAPGPVYDKVPKDAPPQRYTFGPSQTLPGEDDGVCNATFEVFQEFNAWAREGGFVTVKGMADFAKSLLHGAEPTTLTGFKVVLVECTSIDVFRDPDGLTSRARMQFRALIDEADPEP